jgi:hypothetical protein
VTEVLDGHAALDIQCPDRIYLNCYVPRRQTSAQVVAFLSDHLGYPFPSPALFRKLGEGIRKAVATFAADNHIPVVRFGKADVGGKLEVMRPYLQRQAATGRSGLPPSGWRKSSSGCGPPTNARPPHLAGLPPILRREIRAADDALLGRDRPRSTGRVKAGCAVAAR